MMAAGGAWRHGQCHPRLKTCRSVPTDRSARKDFARVLKDLADTHVPDREITRVSDDPDTHRPASLHETFVPGEASRPAGRFDVHHAPKHGSRPGMAETGTGVLSRQCPDRRIADREEMPREVGAWQENRNASARPADRRLGTGNARIRPKSPYPSIQ